ncbi:MAG TPA: hypothetical protein DEA08_20670 [Planctomycetes bacterium]|nr:hypothetical protein [Planctomycetota bacterium]
MVDAVATDAEGTWHFFLVFQEEKLTGERALDLVDALIDGGVARVYPESSGASAAILFCAGSQGKPSASEVELESLAAKLNKFVSTDPQYVSALAQSPHIASVSFRRGEMI